MYNVLPNITFRGVFRYRRGEETPAAQETNATGEIQTVETLPPRGSRVGRVRAVCHTKWIRLKSTDTGETAAGSGVLAPKPLIWRIIRPQEIFRLRYVQSPRQTALIYQRKGALEGGHRWLKT